jgi:hypothetical protein
VGIRLMFPHSAILCLTPDFIFRIVFFLWGRAPLGVRAAVLRIEEI